MQIIFLRFLLFISISGSAQLSDSVMLNGLIIVDEGDIPAPTVSLMPYSDADKSYSTEVKADGSFVFKVPVSDIASYQLQYSGYVKNILFSKAENSIGFLIEVESGKPSKMFISNSTENVAYEILRTRYNALAEVFNTASKESIINRSEWYARLSAFNSEMTHLSNRYPGTVTSKVLVPLVQFPDISGKENPAKYLDQHYFDGADFTDSRLFRVPEFSLKFIYYLNYFSDTTESARIGFIKRTFGKAKDDAEIKSKIGIVLYNLFTRLNKENYLMSYSKWIELQPWARTDLPVIYSRLALVSKVLPGSKAPDIEAYDAYGKLRLMSDVNKVSKLTLVMFWSSGCSHCVEGMPRIKAMYKKYHSSGLDIYAVSLEEVKNNWISYLSQNPVEWTNVYIGPNNIAADNYYVQATPSFALIDGNGEVVSRFMDDEKLEQQIAAFLKN